jgi:hypothetical protein
MTINDYQWPVTRISNTQKRIKNEELRMKNWELISFRKHPFWHMTSNENFQYPKRIKNEKLRIKNYELCKWPLMTINDYHWSVTRISNTQKELRMKN